MTDFSVPQRMSLGSFFFYFFKAFRGIFNAAIFLIVYIIIRSNGGFLDALTKVAYVIAGIVAISLAKAGRAYYQIKFHVVNGNLIYHSSLISSSTTTIPLDRIQTLRTKQSLLYRLLGVRGVMFDTLAGKGEEVELILSESDWQNLLARIESQERPQPATPDTPPAYNPSSVRGFSSTALVLDALCQSPLKGMAILVGFVTVILKLLSDLPDNAIESATGYLESYLDDLEVSVAGVAIIIVAAYIVSAALWIGKVVLRYYDLTLDYDSRMLTFSYGLISRSTNRFARDKICSVSVKRNPLEKKSGLATIAMKQADNSSELKEEDNLKIYGRDYSGFFLGWWLGQDYKSETDIATLKSGNGVLMLSLIPNLLLSVAAAVALWFLGWYGWILLPVIYLLAGIPEGILTMRHSYITLRESYLIVGKGQFAEITNYLKYENVQVLRMTATPFSRFTGRVSLSLSTSGSTFTVRSLKRNQAQQVYELLLAKSWTA